MRKRRTFTAEFKGDSGTVYRIRLIEFRYTNRILDPTYHRQILEADMKNTLTLTGVSQQG